VKHSIFNNQFSLPFVMPEKKFDLEDRLVEFVGRIIEVVEALPKSRGNYIAGQLICEELIVIAAKSIATPKKNIDKKLP